MSTEKKTLLPAPDARLLLAASFVRPGSAVCDVGTDHGYLPIYLILKGICPRAVAADVNALPLEKAREHAARYGCSDRISLYLGDGIKGADLDEAGVRDILICGMGGELIARILEEAEYTRRPGIRCILQPMSSACDLRQYLAEAGYRIEEEKLARAAGRIYTCMAVSYDGICRRFSPAEYLLGQCHIARGRQDSLFDAYLRREIAGARKKYRGRVAGGLSVTAEKELLEELERIAKKEGIPYDSI